MSKWLPIKLGDIACNIQTGPFGSQLHQSDYSAIGTPVVMPKDLIAGKISEQSIARVGEAHVKRLARHQIKDGDILYSRRGDVGRCAYATDAETNWLCGTGCLKVTIDSSKAISKFVFYQLQTSQSVGWVEKHAVGSTMLNLNTSILANIPLSLPPLDVQQKIAGILSAYDDLIENNRKQIKLLEEAAQRLYKEWFIDLRFPGHETTRIINGVPEGWHRTQLKDLILIKYGKDHKNISDGDIPVYGAGGFMRKCSQALHHGEAVLIPRKGSLNNIMYVNESFWTVDTMFYALMQQPNIGFFTYLLLKSIDMYAMNIGAAVPSMTASILNAIGVMLPSATVLKQFHQNALSLFEKTSILRKQNEHLVKSRNRLLQKLL
ncbi:MAG: restriction endonuclease subunit S [Lentisphaerae bacterium]|nr:restriction endonuclease subunit S [Lentisphaerota bacterium]